METQKAAVEELLHKVRISVHSVVVLPKPTPSVIDEENAALIVTRVKSQISREEADNLIDLLEEEKEMEVEEGEEDTAPLLGSDGAGTASYRGLDAMQKVEALGAYKDAKERLAFKAAIGSMIKTHSRDDTLLVVCSMSFPHVKSPALVHMSCMDVLSKPCEKPFLFVRGTQKRILTMDS